MPLRQKKPKASLIDSSDHVTRDVYCIKCGANLRGTLIGQQCEQCLHPVSDSVYGDYLVHSDRAKVRELADAARFVRLGAACLGGVIIIALVATMFAATDFSNGLAKVFNVLFAGAMMCPVLAVIGLLTLTARRTLRYYQVRYGQRVVLRRLMIAAAIILIGVGTAGYYVGSVVSNLILIAWALAPVAALLHGIERLMRRLPNAMVANFARVAFVGSIVCGLAGFGVLWLRTPDAAEMGWQDARLAFTVIAVIGGFALGLGIHQLLRRVEHELYKAAR